MRLRTFVLALLPCCLGAQPLELFEPASSKAAAANALNHARGREVGIRPETIEALAQKASQPGAPVRFAFFPDAASVFETAFTEPGPLERSWVWRGRDPADPAASAILLVRGDRVTGNVRTRDGFFEIRALEGGRHLVREASLVTTPAIEDAVVPPVPLAPRKSDQVLAPKAAAGTPVLDTLVVYTPSARRLIGGSQSIQDSISLAIAEVNASFAASAVNAQIRLLAAVELNLQLGQPEQITGDYLDRIRNHGETPGTTLNALRAHYGADLVSIWVAPCPPEIAWQCSLGMAYISTSDNIFVDTFAYSLVQANVALGPYYTFTHEIGHNMGCVHDRLNSALTGWFPYSYGYQQTAQSPQFVTLMAYQSNGCANCVRINHWSNPLVVYPPAPAGGGVPTGRPASGTNAADNALTINNTAGVIAAFRPTANPTPNQPPTAQPQKLSTKRGAALPVTLRGSDPEQQPLLFDVTLAPAHGSLSGTPPYLSYQPAPGYTGPDQFRFEVSDLRGGFAQAFIDIEVLPSSAGAIGVYRAGAWRLDANASGALEPSIDFQSSFGWSAATPIHGDWNGDGRDKIGVFSNGFWYLDYDGNGVWDGGAVDKQYQFGWSGVTPLVGDWNDDGRETIGIFLDGFWYLDADGDGVWDGPGSDIQAQFGWNGVTPITGDWNGDGRAKIGIFVNGFWYLDYNGSASWDGPAVDRQAEFGWSGVEPLVGDWNGDGRDAIGVYINGFWYLDSNGNGIWNGSGADIQAQFGFAGAAPVLGDWNASGSDKIGIFVNGSWYLDYDGSAAWDNGVQDKAYSFGQSGDTPLVGRW